MGDWAYALATRMGSALGKTDCQDFALAKEVPMADGRTALIAVVSDGAGSAKCAAEGAELACKALLRRLSKTIQSRKSLRGLSGSHAVEAFAHVQHILEQHSKNRGIEVSDLSCTLVATILANEESVFYQIGDGAIVYSQQNQYKVAFWPDHGEFVNETVFITDPKHLDHLMVKRISGRLDSVVMFSDGLQFLVLDFKSKAPHEKFFTSMAKSLATQSPGRSEVVSQWLENEVLASPNVSSRTDDDVSVIVAVMRGTSDG